MAEEANMHIEYFQHELGGKFFYSMSPNPDDGLIGPFDTPDKRDQAFFDFITEQAIIAAQQEIFGYEPPSAD
jgi:hypothetical protein